MTQSKTGKPPATGRVLDFNAIFQKRHGRAPRPQPLQERIGDGCRNTAEAMPSKDVLVSEIEAILAPLGQKGKRLIAELDIENDGAKRGIFKQVVPGDSIVVRAGRTFAEIVFSGMSEQGKLVCTCFQKDDVSYAHEIDFSEFERPTKVWEGTLMDGRYAKVEVAMLPIYSFKGGVIANVDISAVIERTPMTGHLDF